MATKIETYARVLANLARPQQTVDAWLAEGTPVKCDADPDFAVVVNRFIEWMLAVREAEAAEAAASNRAWLREIGATAGGRRDGETGESSVVWLVFPRAVWDAALAESDNEADAIEQLCGWGYDSRGAGRWFWAEPSVKIETRTRVLVTQFGGLDI